VLPAKTFCTFMREFSPERPCLFLIRVPDRRSCVLPLLLVIAPETNVVMIEA
jgi:hypothetical protein